MKFTTTQSDLNQAMQFISSAVAKKSTLPIMSNVLIEAKDDGVTISGTDGEIEKRTTITADVSVIGKTTVSKQRLSDFAQNADSNRDILIEQKKDKVSVRSGRVNWSLNTLPSKEYPEFMEVKGSVSINCDMSELIEAVKKCSHSMGNQDVRKLLNGMAFDLENDKLTIVSTDGLRLSCCNVKTSSEVSRCVIVPRKAIGDIIKMVSKNDDANIVIGENNIKVTAGDMVMYSVLIDGKYPDYRRVVPNNLPAQATVNLEEFSSSIKRALPVAHEKYKGVMLSFSGSSLHVSARNPEQESGTEEIHANTDGADVSIAFNGMFILDATSQLESENITIQMLDGGSSARIDEGDFTAVLMPMRL